MLFSGRWLDREFEIVIFQVASETEAEEFMKNDPAVKKGVMTTGLHPFRVALIKKKLSVIGFC